MTLTRANIKNNTLLVLHDRNIFDDADIVFMKYTFLLTDFNVCFHFRCAAAPRVIEKVSTILLFYGISLVR